MPRRIDRGRALRSPGLSSHGEQDVDATDEPWRLLTCSCSRRVSRIQLRAACMKHMRTPPATICETCATTLDPPNGTGSTPRMRYYICAVAGSPRASCEPKRRRWVLYSGGYKVVLERKRHRLQTSREGEGGLAERRQVPQRSTIHEGRRIEERSANFAGWL